jgi:hypothetical protein
MTAPTLADHHRDAVHYPACNCGAVWRQRGNLTGHCTACHQTFQGIELFDRHQSTDADGRTHCRAGSEIRLGKAEHRLELIDGVWRGPRMSPETIAARFGGTERASNREITTETVQNVPAPHRDDSEPADGRTTEGGH